MVTKSHFEKRFWGKKTLLNDRMEMFFRFFPDTRADFFTEKIPEKSVLNHFF